MLWSRAVGVISILLSMNGVFAAQQAPQLAQTLTGSNITPVDWFGRVVAMGNNYFVVGAPVKDGRGEAYVFSPAQSGWAEEAKLGSGLAVSGGRFGETVAIDGSTVVVGDPFDDTLGFNAGTAYVFVRQGGAWVLQQKLLASGGLPNQQFGQFAEIDGDTCLVGSFASGRIWVFERNNSVWTQLLGLDGFGLGMGRAFSVDGDRFAVGLFIDTIPGFFSTGSVDVYRRERGGWVLEQSLVHDDPAPTTADTFGFSVELDGDSLIAGAPEKDEPGVNCGAAYIFRRVGTTWTQEAKLIADDGGQDEDFGAGVELEGDLAVVTEAEGLASISSFYTFRRTGSTWDSGVEVTPPVGRNSATATSLSGNHILAGAEVDELVNLYVVPEPPATYCTAKVNSAGCIPAVGTTGSPTISGPDDFIVTASNTLPSKPGLFFFGLQSTDGLPFLGGTLCVLPPLIRGPVQLSTAGSACSGTYAYPFQQATMMQAGLLPGDRFFGQFWSRDRAHPDGTGVGLTDAIDVLVSP